jgi:hypothetical protein
MNDQPPRHPQLSAAPTRVLHHATINTGQVVLHNLNDLHAPSVCDFLPMLEQRISKLPGLPGFACSASEAAGCAQFILTHRGAEIVTGGVAWGAGESDTLWRWLGDYYDHLGRWVPGGGKSCPHTPPTVPWLGVVLHLNLALVPCEQAKELMAIERDLALALIRRSLTRN